MVCCAQQRGLTSQSRPHAGLTVTSHKNHSCGGVQNRIEECRVETFLRQLHLRFVLRGRWDMETEQTGPADARPHPQSRMAWCCGCAYERSPVCLQSRVSSMRAIRNS